MKRVTTFVVVMLLLIFAVTKYAYSASSANASIKVKIVQDNIAIELFTSEINFGYLGLGATAYAGSGEQRIGVRNIGASDIDLKLQITACTTSWTAGTAPAANTYVMHALFTEWASTPTAANYGAEDIVLSASATTATTAVYAISGDAENIKGYNIPYHYGGGGSGERNMKVKLIAPTSVTNYTYGSEVTITLTLTAVASQ